MKTAVFSVGFAVLMCASTAFADQKTEIYLDSIPYHTMSDDAFSTDSSADTNNLAQADDNKQDAVGNQSGTDDATAQNNQQNNQQSDQQTQSNDQQNSDQNNDRKPKSDDRSAQSSNDQNSDDQVASNDPTQGDMPVDQTSSTDQPIAD